MTNFSLVNPFITGSLSTTVEDKNPLHAAKTLYMKLSKHFKNNVPRFNFSIKDDADNLYHYSAEERKSGKEVNFVIKPAKMSAGNEKKMLKVVTKKMEEENGDDQQGGKKKEKFLEKDDDSSDSDDSSSSSYSPRRVPYYRDYITQFLYTPAWYLEASVPDTVIVDTPYYYIPSLVLDNGYIVTYGW